MIKLESVSKRFGAEQLFEGLDWHLPEEGMVGLVGPNGAGKTTLFEIMAGRLDPDEGEVIVPRAVDVGYLPQEWTFEEGERSVLEVILEGAANLTSVQERLEELEDRLDSASAEESVELSDEYAELEETFRQRGGYELESTAQEIAAGLGFESAALDRPIRTFSGGWRMRAALGRLLLRHPDILLLDEPTNHLDLSSLEWLEEFLNTYGGTIVTISHDRYFLNALADEIAELASGTLRIFTGDYDTYREKRRNLRERLQKKAKEQRKKRERIQEFVDKFRYNASKASLVQSRLKKLERMEPVEVPEPLETDVSFEFPQPPRVSKTVASLSEVSIAYGDNRVYEDLDFTLYRGEKVAFVGPNGAGKSTLLKMLAGVEKPDSGEVDLGGVDIAYFAQHSLEQLDPDETVFDSMERAASREAYPDIRPVLGAFGFSDDQVEKRVEVLSGGEKARLALARMLLEPAGCLLFDEPTNHLDIPSCQVLEQALQDFEGAICIISHDRYFLNNVVNRVVHIEKGSTVSYKGDYDYYRYKREGEPEEAEEVDGREASDQRRNGSVEGVSPKERRRIRAELREERREETRELREELDEIENRIEQLEERQETLEEKLADPSTYGGEENVEELQREFGEVESELLEWMEKWEERSSELESIRDRYEKRAEELCS